MNIYLSVCCTLFLCANVFAIKPNPILSRGKTVYTSSGTVAYLTDGKYGNVVWQVTNNSWLAVQIETGPSKVFFNWNDPSYAWASTPIAPDNCPNNGLALMDTYDILTSSNSTDGSDGDWTTVLSVTGNPVTARSHSIDFTGASWIKVRIVSGSGALDEIEVFDISNGAEDIWFFPGTSISANTYKGTPPPENFADLITKMNPAFTPAMIRAGVGCQNSAGLADNISTYVSIALGTHYWAIEHGTNDAWGGDDYGVAAFKSNLQKVISACKGAGSEPILARVIATNETAAGWQVHPDFLTAIDDLTKQNNLIEGPDLYSWFIDHPAELNDDGVHPNATGAASIQRLWAEKMAPLYASTDVSERVISDHQMSNKQSLRIVSSHNGILRVNCQNSGWITVVAMNGRIALVKSVKSGTTDLRFANTGSYVISFKADNKVFTKKVVVQ